MAAYNKHPIHFRHVPHVPEVVHNVPQPHRIQHQPSENQNISAQKTVPDTSIQPSKQAESQPKTEEPIDKIKSNPRIAKYSSKIDTLGAGNSFELPAINFISNQDELAVANMDSFMEASEFAKSGYLVLIEGHTDDRGSDEYNMKLSMKRVEKIKQLMVQLGVPEDNISVVGNGERTPLVPNTTEENRLKNRRIEFKIFKM